MQAASRQTTTNQWMTTLVYTLMILAAILLFGWIITRMGLLNRVGNGETIISANTLQLTTETMHFGLEEVQVKAGQEVTIVLDNLDLYGHSFDVDAFDLHVEMAANSRTEIRFTPPTVGTYIIYCAVPGHREAGMVSTLVVEE
jgi:plastocyanin